MSRALGVANKGSPMPSGAVAAGWTPASPTTDGGVLPHTWHYANSGALYQDAAKTTPATADGDPVGASVNQGTDAHDIVQAVAGARPTLKLAIQNGQSVLRLDGGDHLKGAFTGGLTEPYTILAMAQLSAGAVADGNWYYVVSDDNSNNMVLRKSGGNEWQIFGSAGVSGNPSDGDWNAWLALFNGAASQFWHNGISEGSGDAGAFNGSGITFGARNNATFLWPGDISELIIYDSNLSTADKNQLGAYLATKFGTIWTPIV